MNYSARCLVPRVLGMLFVINAPASAWAQTPVDTDSTRSVTPANASNQTLGLALFVSGMLDQSPTLHAAAFSLEAAEAGERAAGRAIYNPEFVVETEDAQDKTRAIGFDQTIDWGGQRGATRRVATGKRSFAAAEYLNVRRAVAAKIFTLLSDYWIAVEVLKLAEFRENLMRDFAEQAQRRRAAGDLAQVEANLAIIGFAQARMRRAGARAGMARILQTLENFNAPPDRASWPRMPATLPELTYTPEDVEQLTAQVPAVQIASAAVETGTANIELVKTLRKPDPTLGLRFGEENDTNLFAVNFSIPVFVRNNYSANVLEALAEKSAAQAELTEAEYEAKARLLFAMQKYALMRNAWADWEKTGAISIDQQLNTLKQLWAAQELTMSEFILQTGASVEVQDTAVELRAELWRSWIEWLSASSLVTVWLGIDQPDQQATATHRR
jgi:cobalt-zinc-cadmium efflux system outer membrane protein